MSFPPLLLNDSLEHFQVDISPTDDCDDLFTFKAFFVLEKSTNAERSRTFYHQAMLLEQ
jgi:hypothetical protein